MFRLPSLPRFSHLTLNTDTPFANEIARQLAWLAEQSKAKGYHDINELARKDMAEFMRLATEWREQQSQRRMPPLLGWLHAMVRSVSALSHPPCGHECAGMAS